MLTQYPANGIHNVRFSAAVRANDGGDSIAKLNLGRVYKGLESGQLQSFQSHAIILTAIVITNLPY